MNTNKRISVGTHSGIFHQDEVVAVALLSILHNSNVKVKRSRDPIILNTCDYLVDVGGGEFDHHMPGGNGCRENNTPYASAGLVWKKYSHDILKSCDCPEHLINDVAIRVDKNIIEPVDKIDNDYMASSLFDFIPFFIPNWNEDFTKADIRFNDALALTREILINSIRKEIVNEDSDHIMMDLLSRHNLQSHILEIPSQFIDWKPKVIKYNTLADIPVDFVVFPYSAGGYAAQAVPPSLVHHFEQRIPFPRHWAGLTSTLPEVSGVDTATFCHNNLFFARAETKEDVYKLCQIALTQY